MAQVPLAGTNWIPGQGRILSMTNIVATVAWQRGADEVFTDKRFSRGHQWSFDGGLTVRASSSPQVVPKFSDPAGIDPEEAFVASLSACHMLTFLWAAAGKGYVVDSYRDEASGLMTKNAQGKYFVSSVTHAAPCGVLRRQSAGLDGARGHASCRPRRTASSPIRSQPRCAGSQYSDPACKAGAIHQQMKTTHAGERNMMAGDLAKYAKNNKIKFFLFNFTDLFGTQRAKLVPAEAAGKMQKAGAGFAGFATWLDQTPAHPDILVMPDTEFDHSAAVAAGSGLGGGRSVDERRALGAGAARGAAQADGEDRQEEPAS